MGKIRDPLNRDPSPFLTDINFDEQNLGGYNCNEHNYTLLHAW